MGKLKREAIEIGRSIFNFSPNEPLESVDDVLVAAMRSPFLTRSSYEIGCITYIERLAHLIDNAEEDPRNG